MAVERTFVAVKPDGVARGLIGEIIRRFERVGLKVVGMKMVWVDKEFAYKHYTEDLEKRRGKHIRELMTEFLTRGPVVAMVIEGVNAIENVRKIVGSTEPRASAPGTIRGDYSHVSYAHADEQKKAVANVIHASANKEDADYEIDLWFDKEEIHTYKRVDEDHTL